MAKYRVIERQYYCKNFTAYDYEKASLYMKNQDIVKDDYTILKMEYNPVKSTCVFVDRIRIK